MNTTQFKAQTADTLDRVSEKAHNLALLNLERHVVHSQRARVALRQAFDFNHSFLRWGSAIRFGQRKQPMPEPGSASRNHTS